MSDPEFQRLITGLGSVPPEGSNSVPGQVQKGENGVWTVNIPPSDASYLVRQMVQVYEYLETIPYKDTVSVALMGLQAICAGPISIIKNVVGGELMGAATQELASYLIVDKFHGGSQSAQIETTPEGLATEIKATQLFLDLGLGVGVGVLAGGIKSVGKEAIPTIPSKTNGQLLGANGVEIGKSITVAGKNSWRIDVENKRPGTEPGNIHLQIRGDSNKYYYNPATGSFYIENKYGNGFVQVSATQNKKLLNMNGVMDGIKKGLYYLGE